MADDKADAILVFLSTCLLIVLTVAVARFAEEERQIAQGKRELDGHVCNRLFHRNLITALDKKTINRGWFYANRKHVSPGPERAIMMDYWKTFYRVQDKHIDYPLLTSRMKGLVKDLKENGDRDLVVDFMKILRECVDDDAYFNDARIRLWGRLLDKEES